MLRRLTATRSPHCAVFSLFLPRGRDVSLARKALFSTLGVNPPPPPNQANKAKLKIKSTSSAAPSLCGDSPEDTHKPHKKPTQSTQGREDEQRDQDSDDEDEDDHDHRGTPQERKERLRQAQHKAMYATKVGAAANISLAVAKGIAGVAAQSTALIADAVNSMGDVISDIVVYYSVQEARKSATPDRPWGRGKVESIGTLSVGGLLLLTGLGIGWTSFQAGAEILGISLAFPSPIDLFETLKGATESGAAAAVADVKSAHPALSHDGIGAEAIFVSGLSIAAKEALYRYTLKVGTAANSSAVMANAHQHRADAVASSAVFAGLLGSLMGYPILDPVASVLVAGLIVKQGVMISMEALRDLSDAPAGAKETEILRQTCLSVKGVLSVEKLLARKSGPFVFVEATIGVDGNISASAAHRTAELTKTMLLEEHTGRVANAVVHVTPLGASGLGESYPSWARDHDFIVAEVKRAVLPIKEIHAVSEVQVYYKDNGLISTKLDILLPPNLTIHQAHAIAVKARVAIEEALPGIGDVDVDLELDEA